MFPTKATFRWSALALLLFAGTPGLPPAAGAAETTPAPAPTKLDFWVGEWDVFLASGPKDGENRIEKILGGFALIENWSDIDGHEGKSWFYFYRPEKRWKQIWMTDTGAAKEKIQTSDAPPGSIRFQGEILRPHGGRILDRTTLTRLPDGRVRQVIEQSANGGATWETGYDAIYVRKPPLVVPAPRDPPSR